MKSYNLIHWTHSPVHLGQLFPEFADAGCVWAPETIFDPGVDKLIVCLSTRINNGKNLMGYSYADDAFTKLETLLPPLFTYPKENVNPIDSDITRVRNRYQFFLRRARPVRRPAARCLGPD